MLIGHTITGNHMTLMIGLSRKNCELLMEGKPILKGPEATLAPMTLIIVGGETEDEILDQLKKHNIPHEGLSKSEEP